MNTYHKNLLEQLQKAKNKLVVTFIEERDADPNWMKYPYQTHFDIRLMDTTDVDRLADTPDVLRNWLGFEVAIPWEPSGRYNGRRTTIEKFTGSDMELLVQLAFNDENIDNHVLLKGKYYTLLFQRVESDVTPFTCLTGGPEEVGEYLKACVEEKRVLAYEAWSGAGYNKVVENFQIEHNKEVSGIPKYGESTVYDIAFVLDSAVLNLEQAQKFMWFNKTETTYRHITQLGTGVRVSLRLMDENEKPKTGRLWVSNNPLD